MSQRSNEADKIKETLSEIGKASATKVLLDKIKKDPQTRKAVVEQLSARYWYIAVLGAVGTLCLIFEGVKALKRIK